MSRAVSWSALSCFAPIDHLGNKNQWGDPEKWYQRYILGIKEKPSKELLFGSFVDKEIQNNPEFLPELERFPFQQHTLKPFYKDIPLIGIFDQWDPYPEQKRLADDKTGKNPWTQKKADETGQLTMYATLLYLAEEINPKEIDFQIRWLETTQHADLSIGFVKDMQPKYFDTKRTVSDVLVFLGWIERTYKEMQAYTKAHA